MEEWRALANSPDTGSDVPDSGPGDQQGLRISESYGDWLSLDSVPLETFRGSSVYFPPAPSPLKKKPCIYYRPVWTSTSDFNLYS